MHAGGEWGKMVGQSGKRAQRQCMRGVLAACFLALLLSAYPVFAIGSPISFAAPQNYPVPVSSVIGIPEYYFPSSIATADLNDDGKPDLVTANHNASVSVLLNDGSGTFRPHVDYTTVEATFMVVIADVNGDHKPDLVVCSDFRPNVSVLLGNGDGTFRPHVDVSVGTSAEALAVSDFNGDHQPDIAVTNLDAGAINIMAGNGDGTFRSPVSIPVGGTGAAPVGMAVGDFDGDGNSDLVTGGGTVNVLLGKGDGTFRTPNVIAIPAPRDPQFVTVSDINGDGKADIIVGDRSFPYVRLLYGNGDGTFRVPVSYSVGILGVPSVAVLDANADGQPDLAAATVIGLVILTNNGDGSFSSSVVPGTGGSGITALDTNGDGRPDLAELSGTVSVLLNTTPPNMAPAARPNPPQTNSPPLPSPPDRQLPTPSVGPPSRSSVTQGSTPVALPPNR
jgi:FG-GAP-like repeat